MDKDRRIGLANEIKGTINQMTDKPIGDPELKAGGKVQNAIGSRKRHTQTEKSTKLAEADALIANGSRQREVARALGISVMTFHRWRKARAAPRTMPVGQASAISQPEQLDRIKELQLENSRLRRVVADMLLEKMVIEENLRGGNGSDLNGYAAH